MNEPSLDPIAAHFERLVDLPSSQWAAAVAALGLSAQQQTLLMSLLEADIRGDERLDRTVSVAALRLRELSSPSPAAGMRLGAWRIEQELGAGGMGVVFRVARDDGRFDQHAALKLLRGFPTEDGRRRLRQERQVLAALEHPWIARLIDGGETDDGQPYFVMEYVDGEPVTEFAARRNLDRDARVLLIDRIAQAVAHAHQRLVIHRDIKPSNVLIRSDGTPRVLDFGVAKLFDASAGSDATSTRFWSQGYASPEQKAGQAVTTATDVFALGALLGELLSGQRPDGRPCERALRPVPIDADLGGILAKASAEDPGARYATVEALRDDLANWREGRPVRAARNTVLYRAHKFVRRHRGSVSLLLLVLVALGIFVWRLGVERDRALVAEALAEQRRVAAEQAAETARSTLDFFASLLGEAAPDRAMGQLITIDQLLEKAAARIARELPPDSAQAALMGGYLGALYGNLGDSARAITLLDPALAQLTRLDLGASSLFAALADTQSVMHMQAGNAAAAAEWSRRAAVEWRRLDAGNGDQRFAPQAMIADGYGHYVLGELEQSVAAYTAALALPVGDARDAEMRDRRAEAAYVLAFVLNSLGRGEEALALVDRMIAELENAGAASSRGMQRLHGVRGLVLNELGRAADALEAIQRSLSLYRAIYGERGDELAGQLNNQGMALNALARFRESRESFEAALSISRNASGRIDDPSIVTNLAVVCDSVGDYACAMRQMRRLLDDPATSAALLPQQQRQLRQNFARSVSLSGDHATARGLLEAALADAIAHDGQASPNTAAALIHVARNESLAGQSRAATAYAALARKAYASMLPAEHYIFAAIDRIDAYTALGERRIDEAASLMESWQASTLASDGADSYWAAIAGLDVASVRHAQGRNAEAIELLIAHLPLLRATVMPSQVERARAERLASELQLQLYVP